MATAQLPVITEELASVAEQEQSTVVDPKTMDRSQLVRQRGTIKSRHTRLLTTLHSGMTFNIEGQFKDEARKLRTTLVQEYENVELCHNLVLAACATQEEFNKEFCWFETFPEAHRKMLADINAYLGEGLATSLKPAENYANSLEAQLDTQKAKSEKEVDNVRRDFSKKLADCLVDNTRLTAEVDNLQQSNVKQATRIAELNSKVEDHQTSGESKSFFNEYEAVKSDLEKAEDELSTKDEYIKNLKDTLTQLENDSKDKVKQLVDSYNALSIKHDSLENYCKTADSEVIELKNKNSQLAAQLNKTINDNLANLTDLSDQN
ncbi:hypothetical protein DAPPUDRAFT_337081, partial [Daphnia pulex]